MLTKLGKILGINTDKNWIEVDSAIYQDAYHKFGGSVFTHPLMIESMSSLASTPVRYFAYYQDNKLLGVIPVWDKYIAGDKRYLKKIGKRRAFDAGNAEVILPLSSDIHFDLPFKGQLISEIHTQNISNLKKQPETLSLARSFQQSEFSKKFRYNRRRELKIFEEAGGKIVSLESLSPDEIARIYIELFLKRWGKKPKAHETLTTFITNIQPLLTGHYLTMDSKPIAIQLIYLAATSKRVSAEYINGGVDPEYKQYSPGSILSFLNINLVEQIAEKGNLLVRFSFGLTDKEYKDTWCKPHPVYRS